MKQSMASTAALLCAGCALGAPTGVRVKTAPAIHVPVSSGRGTVALKDYLSADILKNLLGSYTDSDAKIYQYVPENDKNTLHILVRYPLMNVEIPSKEDLEKYGNLKNYLVDNDIISENDPIDFDSSELIESGVIEKIQSIEGINLADFAHALPGNLGFKSVAAKIYAGPEDMRYKLYGSISANYWQKNEQKDDGQEPETVVFLGKKEDNGSVSRDTMVFKGNPPALTGNQICVLSPKEADDYAKLTSSLPKEGEGIELQNIFNCRPEKLDFCFAVVPQIGNCPGRIAFTVKEIEDMTSLQFTADMVLDISLAFVAVNEPSVVKRFAVADKTAYDEQDIFGRKNLEENSSLFESVQAVTLRLHYDNSLTGSALKAKMKVGPGKSSGGAFQDPEFDDEGDEVFDFPDFILLKTGTKQTSEVMLNVEDVRDHLLKPEVVEFEFTAGEDGTLFSFSPGEDGTGGSFTLRGFEVETVLDRTFPF